MATLFTQPYSPLAPHLSPPLPSSIPSTVYRIHRASAQTRYSFSTGFSAKNQTTILNFTSALQRFGLAHLNQQSNISSPFISVYGDRAHAENVASAWAKKWGEEVWVVSVDTGHLCRGPVFRAADILKDAGAAKPDGEWLHWGEYLIMYRIPAQAIRNQTPVGWSKKEAWRAVGVIGGA